MPLAMTIFPCGTSSAAEKKLILFPLSIYSPKPVEYLKKGARNMLVSRLSGDGLAVVDEQKMLSAGGDESVQSKEKALEISKTLGADYAVFGSITFAGTGYSLDLAVLDNTKDNHPIKRISEAGDENQFIPRLSDVAYNIRAIIEGKPLPEPSYSRPQAAPSQQGQAKGLFAPLAGDAFSQQPTATEKGLFYQSYREYQGFKPTGSLPVNISPFSFDMADVDGDGEDELLVLSRDKLQLYRSKGLNYILLDTFKSGMGTDFLKVSAGDIDRNGKAEIYLVFRYSVRAKTIVLEWDGKFRELDDMIGHVRVLTAPSARPCLIFQDSKVDLFFDDAVYEMDLDSEGNLKKGERVGGLKDARFYTLMRFDLDKDGVPEWIGIGKGSYLHVWDSEGSRLWKGDIKMGGTNNAILVGQPEAQGDPPPRIAFESRISIADIDGDGKYEVMAANNIALSEFLKQMVFYKKSTLTAYSIDGTTLTPRWKTRELPYCITDIQTREDTIFLSAENPKFDNISQGSGRIMWFK